MDPNKPRGKNVIVLTLDEPEVPSSVPAVNTVNDVNTTNTTPPIQKQLEEKAKSEDEDFEQEGSLFEKDGKVQDGVIKELAGCVSNALSKVNISGETVKRIRDVVAKNHKFKPWGAIKLGAKVTKGLQYAGKGITAGLEIWEFYKTFRDQKKLAELKNTLSEGIDELIKDVYALIDSEEEYYEVFAPSYISIREELESRNEVIIALETKEKALGDYENTLKDWVSSQVKDVEYQKI